MPVLRSQKTQLVTFAGRVAVLAYVLWSGTSTVAAQGIDGQKPLKIRVQVDRKTVAFDMNNAASRKEFIDLVEKGKIQQIESARPGLSPKEIELVKALNSTLRVDFGGEPVKNVLEYLEEKSKGALLFVIDEQGLREAKIDPALLLNDPVTKQFRQRIMVRTLLKLILSQRGLGFYVEDSHLVITKDIKTLKKLSIKVYDVADLLDPKNVDESKAELQAALRLLDPKLRFSSPSEPPSDPQNKNAVSPATGAARVPDPAPAAQFFTYKRMLIVRHSFEMHLEIERLLTEMRGRAPAVDLSGVDLDEVRR